MSALKYQSAVFCKLSLLIISAAEAPFEKVKVAAQAPAPPL